jgi:hypothetical protein
MVAISSTSSFFPLDRSAASRFRTRKNLAGAEGFEPPSSVLETDSLTVELTPLLPLSDFAIESLSD